MKEALGPIVRSFRARVDDVPAQTDPVRDMPAFVSEHLARVGDLADELCEEINDWLGPAAADPDATDTQVRRAVSRLEVRLEQLLDDWDEVRRVDPDPADRRGWDLLWRLYRNVVKQVHDWLDELIECLDDPLAALEKRGLPHEKTVAIPLSLVFEAPGETRPLGRWAEGRMREREEDKQLRAEHRSLVARFLKAVGLGWLFGGG